MLKGFVKSGVGEGSFFMGLQPYAKAMSKLLGFRPYKGTLNLAASKAEAEAFIQKLTKVTVPGFIMGTKRFGEVACYPCTLQQLRCAIIVPRYTRYDLSTVEVIAKEHLRTTLSLKDGDELTIEAP
jgi:riboflavin kinase